MPGATGASVLDLADRSGRWGDLGTRALSAAVLAPIGVASVWVGGVAFTLVVLALTLGLAVEWLLLCRRPVAWSGFQFGDCPVGQLLLGFLYVGLAGGALLWLRADPIAGRADVLFLLLIVWAGDVGAYLVGRWIGGPRLAPRISPGKTWSGAVGGLLAAVFLGLAAAHMLSDGVSWRVAAVAVTFGVIAQGGDLLESYVKRRLQVKDSSHLIPGHGGLFDRLDGVLATAPVAALLALTQGRGVVLWQ